MKLVAPPSTTDIGQPHFELLDMSAVTDGPLHRSDYDRKPRGALIAPAGEAFVRRFSLCCGREGCRKRATPPSLRFLGRRVYLGAVVLVASMLAQALGTEG